MARKMADCRRWPSESNCSLVIIGEEDEVARAAAEHAVSAHSVTRTRRRCASRSGSSSSPRRGTRPARASRSRCPVRP